jgi:hypothetical protein
MGNVNSAPLALAPDAIATHWLDRLRLALESSEPGTSFARLLLPDGYLRDQVLLSWDLRTLHGEKDIAAYVTGGLGSTSGSAAAGGIFNITLDVRAGLEPERLEFDEPGAIQLAFTMETQLARARGSARLFAPTEDAPLDQWRAGSVFFVLDSLKGHEETGFDKGLYGQGGVRIPWTQVKRERRELAERDPYVVISA